MRTNDKITKEMVYLCIGDDIDLMEKTELQTVYFEGIKYYAIQDEKVIKGETQVFCSCNEKYCWHIFKVVLHDQN